MKLVYVDSSALVSVYVGEPIADIAAAYLDSQPALSASLLTYAEVLAVLNRHRRQRQISSSLFRQAKARLEAQVAGFVMLPLELVRPTIAQVCYHHVLKGADALHLALALEATADAEVEIATFDKALARESARAGLGVWPLLELR